MSKPKIPNQKRKYNDLSKRVTKYILLLKSIYETLNLEAAKIVESTGVSFDEKKPFSFDDFPKTKKKVENLLEKYRSEIYVLIYNSIAEEWKNSNLVQDLLADSVLKAYEATIDGERRNVIYQTNSDALKSFLARKDRGMNLSDKIWLQSIEYRNSLEETISCAIEKGTSAVTLSKRVSKYMNDYPSLRRDYSRIYGKASTSYDCEYRSMRLAASEINMAYRSAENLRWQQMDFVVGYEIKLSGNHNCKGVPKGQFYDICDDLKGKYPKDFVWTGWHPLCYSDDSEVYTDSGWKLFKDVQNTDRILSLNPDTFDLEYTNILLNFRRWYKGDMIHLYNRSLSQLVTPEHEVLHLNKSDMTKFKRTPAERCGTSQPIYRSSKWIGEYNPYVKVGNLQIKIEDYAEFMGYWLSDGSLGNYPEVSIAQQDDNRYNIHRCMERINGKAWMGKYKVGFNVKDWYEHLKPFGKCTDKYVPECIKQSTPRIIEIFLKAFVSCDGYIRKPKSFIGSRGTLCESSKEERIYVTTSVRMADDIGELILKVGHRPSFYIEKVKGKVQKFRNGEYTINNDCFRISECYSTTATQYKKERVQYDGYVYDLTLEKNHIMYIRRNGKCFWGSNCRCYKIPILKTEEEFWSWDGRGEAPTDSINKVNDVPSAFKKWLKDNNERYKKARERGTLPYFMRENDKYTRNK